MIGTKVKIQPTAIYKPLPWQIPAWRDKSQSAFLVAARAAASRDVPLKKYMALC